MNVSVGSWASAPSLGGVPTRRIAFCTAAACAIFLPLVLFDQYQLYEATLVALASLGAVSLNLLTGTAGQVSLGNAAFLGIGGFCAVFATKMHIGLGLGLLFAIVVSALLGLAVGLPAARLRGLYLMLSTLALLYVFLFFANIYQTDTAGASGFTITANSVFGFHLTTDDDWYVFCSAIALLNVYIAANQLNGRCGRAWRVIRQSEVVAEGLGVPSMRYKLWAFMTSSAMIGLQGAITAYFLGNVSVDNYTLSIAIIYVAMIVVGGLDSIWGSLIGAAVITLLPTEISAQVLDHPSWPSWITVNAGPITSLLYGILIIVILLVAPRGVVGAVRSLWLFTWSRIDGRRASGSLERQAVGVHVGGDSARSTPAQAESANPDTGERDAILRVEAIDVRYGQALALSKASFTVGRGQICLILGANGAGKTTLLRGITGFDSWETGRITGGQVTFESYNLTGARPSRASKVGLRLVPERISAFLSLTVEENLRLAAKMAPPRRDADAAWSAIERVFPVLHNRARQSANLLSGGERQMLGISMGLLGCPSLLAIDEPSAGLAPAAVRGIFAALDRLRAELGLTLIIVEQNVAAAVDIADKVCVVRGGTIVFEEERPRGDFDKDSLYRLITGGPGSSNEVDGHIANR